MSTVIVGTVDADNLTDGTDTRGVTKVINGSAVAFCRWTTVTTSAIIESFGISSITDGGAGITNLNFSAPFTATTDYSCVCSGHWTGGNTAFNTATNIFATTYVKIYNYNESGTNADSASQCAVILSTKQ